MPTIEKEKPIVAKQVFEQMKLDKVRGEKSFLVEYHAKKCQDLVRLHKP